MEGTSHEILWKGSFGNEYTVRNRHGEEMIACRVGNLARCLARADYISSSLEIGSNIGYNEIALQRLYPDIKMDVVEINKYAADECAKIKNVSVYNTSVYDFTTENRYDLTFVNGVLIYIDLDKLAKVYESLYTYSKKYILIVEYYNPTPVDVKYRGLDGQMCKRDFAGEMLDKYSDLNLLDYGFIYHRDKAFPMDDFNWFLLEKISKTYTGGGIMMAYNIVSMGCACGVARSMEKYGLRQCSGPFDWYVSKFSSLLHFMETDFSDFLDRKNMKISSRPNEFYENKYDCYFANEITYD